MMFAIVLVFASVFGVSSHAAVSPSFEEALKAITKVFGELQQSFTTVIVEPEARAQAARYLGRLSNRLGDVAIEKQQLTHDLLSFTLPRDQAKLERQVAILQRAIIDLQRSLRDFFVAMPPSWQTKGGALEQDLEQILGLKWERLQGMSQRFANDPAVASADLVNESKQVEAMLGGARTAVDELISALAAP